MAIEKGSNVKLHYTGKFEDGNIFDTSKERDPIEITVGSNQIISKLEESMLGMSTGEEKSIELEPKDAYGERNEELIKEVPLSNLPEESKVGSTLSAKTPDGDPLEAIVKEMKEETAVLDFNHILSGKKLIFDLNVIDVKEGTEASTDGDDSEAPTEDGSTES